jgi:hypothetical protein
MAAPDDRQSLSSEPRAALLHVGSCVLDWRPPDLAISGATFRRDPLAGPRRAVLEHEHPVTRHERDRAELRLVEFRARSKQSTA